MSKIAQSQETVQGLNLGGPYSTTLNHLTTWLPTKLYLLSSSPKQPTHKLQGHSLP